MRIIFVCTGNTCRSPMAESIAKSLSSQFMIESRGISAFDGAPVSLNAERLIQRNHLPEAGTSTSFRSEDHSADLILTMTRAHKMMIKMEYPESNVHTLIEYATGDPGDIQDPYGGSLDVYEQTFDELKYYIEKVVRKLENDKEN